MAIVVDAARPVQELVERAAGEFTQDTDDIVYDNAFVIRRSVVDGHIRTLRTHGSVNVPVKSPQAAYPIVDFDDFWIGANAGVDQPARLNLFAFAPTISAGVNLTFATVVLDIDAFAPNTPGEVEFTTINATFTLYAPDIGSPVDIEFVTIGLDLFAFAPTVAVGDNVTFTTPILDLSLEAPLIEAGDIVFGTIFMNLTVYAPEQVGAPWIMFDGVWNDDGIWDDTGNWDDTEDAP